MWISVIAIALGAALGANLRWWLSLHCNAHLSWLPLGTLIANLLGAYLIGVALCLFQSSTLSEHWKLFVITGLLGALTTFSTFSAEMVTAMQQGRWLHAALGTAVHVLGSFTMTALGIACYRWFASFP